MLALSSLKGKTFLYQIFCIKLSIFVSSLPSTYFQKNFFYPNTFWQNQTKQHNETMFREEGFSSWVHFYSNNVVLCKYIYCYPFCIQTFGKCLSKQYSWVYINLATRFSCSSWWQFGFLLHPGKFSVMPNYLNFFISDCTVDLGIGNWFEIVL